MIVKLIRCLLALFLVGVALAVPMGIYAMNQSMASVLGTELSAVIFVSSMGGGFWLLLITCGLALLGAIGLLFRKIWGRILAMSSLGLFAAIALFMFLLPSDVVQNWFSFYTSRTSSVIEFLICSAALAWLCLPVAKRELYAERELA